MFGGGGGAGCKRGMSPLPSLHLLLYSLKLWHVRWTGRDGSRNHSDLLSFYGRRGLAAAIFIFSLFPAEVV